MSDNSCPFVAPCHNQQSYSEKVFKEFRKLFTEKNNEIIRKKGKNTKSCPKVALSLSNRKRATTKKAESFQLSAYGAEEARTLYLIAASDALSQVSYDPMNKEIVSYFACYMQYIYLFYPEYAYILDNFWTYILFAVIIIRIF